MKRDAVCRQLLSVELQCLCTQASLMLAPVVRGVERCRRSLVQVTSLFGSLEPWSSTVADSSCLSTDDFICIPICHACHRWLALYQHCVLETMYNKNGDYITSDLGTIRRFSNLTITGLLPLAMLGDISRPSSQLV